MLSVLRSVASDYTFGIFKLFFKIQQIYWNKKLDLQLPMQSVPITTDVVSSNLDQGEVYNIVIKFVCDLRQVGGFLWILWFPPPIKMTATT